MDTSLTKSRRPLNRPHSQKQRFRKSTAQAEQTTMSLYWIHCNRCFEKPNSHEAKYYVTNCGHMYCRKCAGDVNKSKSCGVCDARDVRFVQIGPKMSKETKKGFKDQNEMLHELFRQLEFQATMYIGLVKKLKAQKKEAVEFAKRERDRLVTVVFTVMSSG